jgi:hypothetical protein
LFLAAIAARQQGEIAGLLPLCPRRRISSPLPKDLLEVFATEPRLVSEDTFAAMQEDDREHKRQKRPDGISSVEKTGGYGGGRDGWHTQEYAPADVPPDCDDRIVTRPAPRFS